MTAENEHGEEPRDRTKLLWGGVILLVLILTGVMWGMGRAEPAISEARVRHILISADPAGGEEARNEAYRRALAIREALLEGESFSEMARQYSDDPQSARRGGDLGYYPKDTFEDAFEAYVWDAGEVGEISPVIVTDHGFHIVQILDRRWSRADKFTQEIRRRTTGGGEAGETEETE
ncbi:MAG: peptidylprolyl isomerase [Candidatus Hydrogenedentota bacterium]